MNIYDCFMFSDEFMLLELRMKILFGTGQSVLRKKNLFHHNG